MSSQVEALILGRVIGDVVDSFTPSVSLRLSYNYNGRRRVFNACEFRPSQIVNPPTIEIIGGGPDNFYTLVMVDPDAPSPVDPTSREYLHWLVSNIPSTDEETTGQEVMSYENPQPTRGIHRLVFTLFRQTRWQTIRPRRSRHNFSTREFADYYDFGLPVTALYYTCQRESGCGGRRF